MTGNKPITIRFLLFTLVLVAATKDLKATSAIVLRSRYRVVLATDSRAVYGQSSQGTECKLFETHGVFATVSGLAHYGNSYRATDAVREGFAGPGTFADHVSATAGALQRSLEMLLAYLQTQNPTEYRNLSQRNTGTVDFVQLALAQTVRRQPMIGLIELRRNPGANTFTVRTSVCPGNCRQDTAVFYLGYWERIRPYVADSGNPRSLGSAASLDRLIRMEMMAHPAEVGAPINILEVNATGARWLQNGGNCTLPGVGW